MTRSMVLFHRARVLATTIVAIPILVGLFVHQGLAPCPPRLLRVLNWMTGTMGRPAAARALRGAAERAERRGERALPDVRGNGQFDRGEGEREHSPHVTLSRFETEG
jgi:hypothetical protein